MKTANIYDLVTFYAKGEEILEVSQQVYNDLRLFMNATANPIHRSELAFHQKYNKPVFMIDGTVIVSKGV